MQDYIQCIGIQDILGPRPVIMESFRLGLITQGEKWLELLEDRNSTSHVYNKNQADHIVGEIKKNHYTLLAKLEETLKQK